MCLWRRKRNPATLKSKTTNLQLMKVGCFLGQFQWLKF
jgi:hypothetical protein